jgi:hypothetical protein
MSHGGAENGRLLAPYSQLVKFGMSRKSIASAIREAEQLGLIRVRRGGKKGTTMTECSRYTLTYLWTKSVQEGYWQWEEPTNDWQEWGSK